MPDDGVSIGELSRQVRDVLIRFQGLADRLDNTYVSKELFILNQELVNKSIKALEDAVAAAAKLEKVRELEAEKLDISVFDALASKVSSLEDDRKWLMRLVAAFIIMGILGVVFVTSGVPK